MEDRKTMAKKILVADDDPALLEMMALTLSKEGFDAHRAASAAEARERIAAETFDLVVSDIYLGDATALDLLDEIRVTNPDATIILVTAQGTVETAAAATAAGVFDYLAKPFALEQLVARVRAALARSGPPTAPVHPGPESMIVGNHPGIVEVYKAVARVAPLSVPVLVRGETGTGKELVARALHVFGSNPRGPFVALNCGAIPETLLESELFGHRKGAFTGADRDHRGAIEQASGGTVFLDEVGELPPLLQVKLLRFLQEGEIRPLGSESSMEVSGRVVAATNRDLRRAVGLLLPTRGVRDRPATAAGPPIGHPTARRALS
jgi:two-component system nitrogen regulation response regulator GlnG